MLWNGIWKTSWTKPTRTAEGYPPARFSSESCGRISSRKVLIGIHDVLDSMSHLEMLTKGSESEAVAAKASGISVKSTL